ncbi:hypothetical protein [Leifsonia sp. NPDC058230]|uniref:hypothetical protein n=1 Tax=Leifsonia sp. NPDC058230 TaxID=3346391 RepID=UPI0036DAE0E7
MNEKRKVLAASSLAIVTALALSSCSVFDAITENQQGHIRAIAYATGAEGLASTDATLPSWVPADARDIKEKIRTTGSERILIMRSTLRDLPGNCEAHTPGTPIERAPKKLDSGATLTYLGVPTIEATWWPEGVEKKASVVCDGSWWIASEGEQLYAFSPERSTTKIEN